MTNAHRASQECSLKDFDMLDPHQQLFLLEALLQPVAVLRPPFAVQPAHHHFEDHNIVALGARAVPRNTVNERRLNKWSCRARARGRLGRLTFLLPSRPGARTK